MDPLIETKQICAFGSNGQGQLGIGHRDDVSVPTPCIFNECLSAPPQYVAAGANHTLVQFMDGAVWAAGENCDGRCGLPPQDNPLISFHKVRFPGSNDDMFDRFKYVAATEAASIFVTYNDEVYTCGTGFKGELGQGPDNLTSREPKQIRFPGFSAVSQVSPETMDRPAGRTVCLSAGMSHVVLVSSAGDVYGWGWGRQGQLGEWDEDRPTKRQNNFMPKKILKHPASLVEHPVQSVCGQKFTALFAATKRQDDEPVEGESSMDSDGPEDEEDLWENFSDDGEMGIITDDDTTNEQSPASVNTESEYVVEQILSASSFPTHHTGETLAEVTDELMSFGPDSPSITSSISTDYSDGDITVASDARSSSSDDTTVASDPRSSLVDDTTVTSDHTAFDRSSSSEDDTPPDNLSPSSPDFPDPFGEPVQPIDAGAFHISGDDDLKWGLFKNVPQILPPWRQVAACWSSLLVLTETGELLGFGRNDYGQLGPADLPPIRAIAAGTEHLLLEVGDKARTSYTSNEDAEILACGWGEHGNTGPVTAAKPRPGVQREMPINTIGFGAVLGAGWGTSWVYLDQERDPPDTSRWASESTSSRASYSTESRRTED